MTLPTSLRVLERGWLSANNVVFFDGDEATIIDSGYVTTPSKRSPWSGMYSTAEGSRVL